MSQKQKQKENVFNNMKTITKQDIEPNGEWIKQSIKLRNNLIKKQDSAVVFNRFEKEAMYHLFREYSKHPVKTIDEIITAKPLSQRIIGAHGRTYDNNFFICRLLGYSVINLRLSHILDKEFENRFYCNDQQHAFMYEYGIINQDKEIDLVDFKEALDNVVSENGTPDSNPILEEINQWIEKAEDIGEMKWSQVKNSNKFSSIKEKMEEPLMVEFTYTYNRPATNKTQKINDNPYGWGDYQKLRNQLSHNETLYETVFTEDGNNLEYFHTHSLSNDFFSADGNKFIKRQYFATNAQPSNQEYTGEIEAAFLKLLITFIDENGMIDFTTNGITKKDFLLIKDGSMYSNLESYTEKWNKLDEQLSNPDNAEQIKDDIKKLRTLFFDYLKGILPLAKSNTKRIHNINTKFNREAIEFGKLRNPGGKQVLNIKDMRLTKLENALWFMKNSIILSELYGEKTAKPIGEISKDYVNIFFDNVDNFLNENTKSNLNNGGSGSATRYEYLSLWNNDIFKIVSNNLKTKKVTTSPTLRKKQNELFSVAKSRTDSPFDFDGYYFCPTESIWLNESNTDLGHDLLKKNGRKADMDTIFIQGRKMNRTFNKGNFPNPKNYYKGILKSYANQLDNINDIPVENVSNILESKKIIEQVVNIYENGEHLKIK